MKKKNSLKIFISLLISIFLIFLFFFFKPYNYQKTYDIKKYKITEKYNKKDKEYTFIINYKNTSYPYVISNKYINKRELINNIDEYKKDEEICIIPKSKEITFYPLCSKNNNVYANNLSQINIKDYKLEKVKNINKEYQKINILATDELYFLLYNYKGFLLINDQNKKEISLFNKDKYNINLYYQIDNYLIIPDYNEEYYFDKFYLINIYNGKLKEIKSEQLISFDSVFLGDFKNKIYLLDKKEEKEYFIDIKKLKITETDFVILKNNKLISSSYKEIINKNLTFDSKSNSIDYQIIDNNLYMLINKIKIKISEKNVNKIVKIIDNTVYYLIKDDLYEYNPYKGEVLLLNNFEWEFNYNNMIFIAK